MRILFICGSFEKGRDGVGDYTRRLCIELQSEGHNVAVAAINDKHISSISDSTVTNFTHLTDVNEGFPVFRLPGNVSKNIQQEYLEQWIKQFDPEWLSLQFVSFSFHPKGLDVRLSKLLRKVGKGRKWHIMFHELWVGMTNERSNKEWIWGLLQRHLIKSLILQLNPKIIHTHTQVYKMQLEKIGAEVILLPLFSNIPIFYPEKIREKLISETRINNRIKIIIFGGIHVGGPIKELAKEAKKYCDIKNVSIELIVAGRNGSEGENWKREWESAGLNITQLGEQSEERISEILAEASFGIFTTPISLVEKSGSVAAMREHGLHLLCVSRAWTPKGMKLEMNPYGIREYREGGLEDFLNGNPDFSYLPTPKSVAKQFLLNLRDK